MSAFIFALLGILLGALSKAIDNLSVNDEILWQRILGIIDLRNILSRVSIWALIALIISVFSKKSWQAAINVFVFFAGMLAGYYTITIMFSGFFPKTEMISWGIIALFTPALAFVTWHAKGTGRWTLPVSAMVVGVFINQAVFFGLNGVYIRYYPECVFAVISIIVLFKDLKQLLYMLVSSIIIALALNYLLPYIMRLI